VFDGFELTTIDTGEAVIRLRRAGDEGLRARRLALVLPGAAAPRSRSG
jgi:hypothetical protein